MICTGIEGRLGGPYATANSENTQSCRSVSHHFWLTVIHSETIAVIFWFACHLNFYYDLIITQRPCWYDELFWAKNYTTRILKFSNSTNWPITTTPLSNTKNHVMCCSNTYLREGNSAKIISIPWRYNVLVESWWYWHKEQRICDSTNRISRERLQITCPISGALGLVWETFVVVW